MRHKIDINKLLNLPGSWSEQFHEKTKIKHNKRNIPDKKLDVPESWKTIYYKGYIRFKKVVLPQPDLTKHLDLKNLIEKRESIRKYSTVSLSLKKLSTILYYSFGLKRTTHLPFRNRFYPSAGARYPLEVYVILMNTVLSKGVYHYNIKSGNLECLSELNRFNANLYFLSQKWISNAGCIVLITAIFRRTTDKYGDRGYRNILIEAGHIGQNIYMVCEALNIGCCAVTGFNDDKLNELLDIDGLNESILYAFILGNKKTR